MHLLQWIFYFVLLVTFVGNYLQKFCFVFPVRYSRYLSYSFLVQKGPNQDICVSRLQLLFSTSCCLHSSGWVWRASTCIEILSKFFLVEPAKKSLWSSPSYTHRVISILLIKLSRSVFKSPVSKTMIKINNRRL